MLRSEQARLAYLMYSLFPEKIVFLIDPDVYANIMLIIYNHVGVHPMLPTTVSFWRQDVLQSEVSNQMPSVREKKRRLGPFSSSLLHRFSVRRVSASVCRVVGLSGVAVRFA